MDQPMLIGEIRSCFSAVNSSGTGRVSRSELRAFFGKHGRQLSDSDLDAVFGALCTSRDGFLTFENFLEGFAASLQTQPPPRPARPAGPVVGAGHEYMGSPDMELPDGRNPPPQRSAGRQANPYGAYAAEADPYARRADAAAASYVAEPDPYARAAAHGGFEAAAFAAAFAAAASAPPRDEIYGAYDSGAVGAAAAGGARGGPRQVLRANAPPRDEVYASFASGAVGAAAAGARDASAYEDPAFPEGASPHMIVPCPDYGRASGDRGQKPNVPNEKGRAFPPAAAAAQSASAAAYEYECDDGGWVIAGRSASGGGDSEGGIISIEPAEDGDGQS